MAQLKRKNDDAYSNVSDLLMNLNVLDKNEELQLLQDSCNSSWDECNVVSCLRKAEYRYRRYIRHIDLSEHTWLINSIGRFFSTQGTYTYERFQQMKKIDFCFVEVLASQLIEHPAKKQKL